MNKKQRDRFITSILASLMISFLFFFVLQGLFIDQVDEFVTRALDQELINNLSILNYIIIAYLLLIYASFSVVFEAIMNDKQLSINKDLAFLISIIVMLAISWLGIKLAYPHIVGIDYFILSIGMFMGLVLESQFWFFVIFLGIFLGMLVVITVKR